MNSDRIAEVAAGVLDQFALDLDDVEIKQAGRFSQLQIVVDGDGPDGTGPALDDIAEATKVLSSALDSAGVTGSQSYTLEVTSRGTDRLLTLPRHWRRNAGRLVRAAFADGESLTGRIVAADESTATLEVAGGDAQVVQLNDVTDARIQVEMGGKPRHQPGEENSGDSALTDHSDQDRTVAREADAVAYGQSEKEH